MDSRASVEDNRRVDDADRRRAVLSSDTSAAAEAIQVRAWRAMAPADIARIIDELSSLTRALAIAGLRERYPNASESEVVARLAEITLGRDLARRVYRALGLSGYARIDLRLDQSGRIYVLEANPNPQISRDEDFAESALKADWTYGDLLRELLNLGLRWCPAKAA